MGGKNLVSSSGTSTTWGAQHIQTPDLPSNIQKILDPFFFKKMKTWEHKKLYSFVEKVNKYSHFSGPLF